MATNNVINLDATGIVTYDGSGGFTGSTVTQGAVLLGGASNAVSDTGVLAKGTIMVGDGTTDPTLLSVGTNTHVLTADSAESSGVKWAAASVGSGDLVYISSATASSSANINFTGLSSSYFMYIVELDSVTTQTQSVNFMLRTSTDNGSTYDSGASDYSWAYIGADGAQDTADTAIVLFNDTGDQSTDVINGVVYIINPSDTEYTQVLHNLSYWDNGSYTQHAQGGGQRNSAADVDAIRFLASSGNIVSGTFRLWGLKE